MPAPSAAPTRPAFRVDWAPDKFTGAVYDVGMHDGTDTAFYLQQGYAVLAIEADPLLAALAVERFAAPIAAGQLQILNVGIAEDTGAATFWVCDDNSVWNSFDRTIASRNASRHHPVEIETRRFADILETFGVPDYLKIDIEGCDSLCVADLDRRVLPRFISVETECVGDDVTLTDSEATAMLTRLRDAGYTRFQLVSQEDFRTVVFPDRWKGLRHLIDSAAWGKLRAPGVAAIARRLSHRGRLLARHSYEFACGGTGPWGPGLLGRWVNFETARATYLAIRSNYFANGATKSYSFWYDWHATY